MKKFHLLIIYEKKIIISYAKLLRSMVGHVLRKGGMAVSRRGGLMSDSLKEEIAKELGVYDTVKSEGWGSVSSRDCGNIVKKAIEMAERNIGR